jgi:hypothetical protein
VSLHQNGPKRDKDEFIINERIIGQVAASSSQKIDLIEVGWGKSGERFPWDKEYALRAWTLENCEWPHVSAVQINLTKIQLGRLADDIDRELGITRPHVEVVTAPSNIEKSATPSLTIRLQGPGKAGRWHAQAIGNPDYRVSAEAATRKNALSDLADSLDAIVTARTLRRRYVWTAAAWSSSERRLFGIGNADQHQWS